MIHFITVFIMASPISSFNLSLASLISLRSWFKREFCVPKLWIFCN